MSPASTDDALRTIAGVVGDLAFLTPLGVGPLLAAGEQELAVHVAFRGSASGTLVVALAPGLARALVDNLAPPEPGCTPTAEDLADAAKELANVLAGNLLATLHGAQAEFQLGSPELVPPADLPATATFAIGLILAEGGMMAGILPA
ncbi:MAG: chemotaxis protein CheX [Planctomycetes bacterium]|nr:chemotaxis protein CheX [Planctomycetota bacterium]